MRVIRQIQGLRRLSGIAATERARNAPRVSIDPGPLVEFIPRVSPHLLPPHHLRDLTDSFERGLRELGSVTDAHSMPVRTGKTTTVEHAIPWILLKQPWRKILYLTYQHDVAEERTIAAQRVYLDGGGRLGIIQRGGFWHTEEGGFCLAAGIGGPLTGRGFTDIICDDLHKNRKEAESRIIREGVVKSFYSDVYTRRDRRGTNIWVIGARWHPNDVVGAVSRHPKRPFTRYNLAAMAADGTSNVPDFYPDELLQAIRETVGEYAFGGLYQGDPKLPGGKLFGSPWSGRIDELAYRCKTAIGIDLVRGKKTRTDFNAAAALRLNGDTGNIDVIGAVRAKGTIMDRANADLSHVDEGFLRLLVAFIGRHPGAALVMRAANAERALVELLRRSLSSILGREIQIHVLEAQTEKWIEWQPYAMAWNDREQGRIRFRGRSDVTDPHDAAADADDEWQGPFIDEHLNAEGLDGEQNDWVDCGSAAYDFLINGTQTVSLVDAMTALGRIR